MCNKRSLGKHCCGCDTSDLTDDRSEREVFAERLKVEFVGEAQTDEDAIINVLNGDIQLVYISPESLLL